MTTFTPDPFRRFAEGAALAAALAVPLFFAPAAGNVFEAPKAALLRFLGAAALGGLLLARRRPRRPGPALGAAVAAPAAAVGLRGPTAAATWVRGHPLLAAMVAVVAVEAVATAASVVPVTSLLGSHARSQGLVTSGALLALAVAAASAASRPGGPWRVAAWMAAPALPAAAYGILQWRPWALDPLPWAGDTLTRVAGPGGSSVFFAAHLALVAPLLAALAARGWRTTALEKRGLAAPVALAAATAALLLVAVALVLSGSRGPVLGLGLGAWAGGLGLAAAGRRPRRAAALSALAVAALAAVVALNVVPGARDQAARVPLVGRMAFALDPERSTTRVRLRLWEASADAVTALGKRGAVGYGPEVTDRIWAAFYPSILAYDEPRGYVPDRAHNMALDALLTTGVLGLAAQLALLAVALDACLALLGVGTAPGRLLWWAGGGATGGASALVLAGPRMAGLGLGLGLLAGFVAWLTLRAPGGGAPSPPPAHQRWLAASLLAVVVAHFAEIQVGFEVVSTRLGYWLALGILAGARSSPWPSGKERAPSARPCAASSAAVADGALAAFVVIAVWTYTFGRAGLVAGGATVAVALVVAGAAAAALVVASAEPSRRSPRPRGGPRSLAGAAMAVAAAGIVYAGALITCRRLGADGSGDAVPAVAASLLALMVSLVLALAVTARRGPGPTAAAGGRKLRGGGRRRALGLGAITVGLAAVAMATLAPVVADAADKEARLAWLPLVSDARSAADFGRALSFLDRAEARMSMARRLAPWEAAYALDLARLGTERADLLNDVLTRELAVQGIDEAPDPSRGEYDPALLDGEALGLARRRDRAMAGALDQASAADGLSAPGPEAPLIRARALRVWGSRTRQPARRRARLQAAAEAYGQAIHRAPNWPEVYDEAAWVAILAGDAGRALTRTAEALEADPFFLRAHRTAAQAHASQGNLAAAAAEYDAYFADERNASDIDAQRGRLGVLAAMGRQAEALAVAEETIRLTPNDPWGYADLAVLRQAEGDLPGARRAAATAAALAPSDPEIAALVEELSAAR